ncbi:uncharacterized protein LOC135696894 [Ochlerotatus camptorhynchus]|uniref:uncharacterized protein LOC135696894 n=1 Tax=Ochlerotatus camptorhynchus TaxID=644619 RepID=UPI0031D2E32A
MKIIPMMVVLICASGSWHHGPSPPLPWKASALELRIPGLGRVKMEFQTDVTSETPADGVAMETVSKGESKRDDGKQATNPSTAATLAKDSKQTTQKIDREPSKTTAVKDKPTEAPAKETEAKATTLAKDSKQTTQTIDNDPSNTTAVKDKPTEAPAKATTATTDGGKQQPNNKPTEATTAEAKQTTDTVGKSPTTEQPKEEQDAASDPDEFDDSDIWDDMEDPPEEFGREYDLDPSLFDSGGDDLGDFQPKLQLPPNMTKDMFFDAPVDAKPPNPADDDDDAEGNGIFERIKRFFSIANIKEQLDTIPGKMQALMDRFRHKKSDGLKKLREKMDGLAEKEGQKIAKAFSKLKAPKQNPQQCIEQIEKSFKQYEAALQGGIQPCMHKVQSVMSKQEGALRNAQAKFSRMLTDMQDCANKLDSSGVNSIVKSILNIGSCTKMNIQSKIEDSLQPQMKRLSEMVQQQGSKLNGNMNATGLCVERQLQLPQFQTLQEELVAKGRQCLERGG